ncbi:hypothetical protein L618_001700000250 [Rhodococcus rhodochrous J45]|uniref:Uncharacterized protein n=1 Tax=Rhodococcus rhodochrous J45 TaxID=935266 RepID=A0A562E7M3_RHORH|nr:hypothetical protein L618_001700000250 [Rhodococcus rhodochrous J45]
MQQLQQAVVAFASRLPVQAEHQPPHGFTMPLRIAGEIVGTDEVGESLPREGDAGVVDEVQFGADTQGGCEEMHVAATGVGAVPDLRSDGEMPTGTRQFEPQITDTVGGVRRPGAHEFVQVDLRGARRVHAPAVGVEQEGQQHLEGAGLPRPVGAAQDHPPTGQDELDVQVVPHVHDAGAVETPAIREAGWRVLVEGGRVGRVGHRHLLSAGTGR